MPINIVAANGTVRNRMVYTPGHQSTLFPKWDQVFRERIGLVSEHSFYDGVQR